MSEIKLKCINEILSFNVSTNAIRTLCFGTQFVGNRAAYRACLVRLHQAVPLSAEGLRRSTVDSLHNMTT